MTRETDIESYATLDFEASSLSPESWPIEIGLSWLQNDRVQTWHSLIRPVPEWDILDWSAQSAAVHKIAFETLLDAPPAAAVVNDFFNNLAGKVLMSDAPEFEVRWLARLLTAAGCVDVPKIADYHDVSFKQFSGLALDILYESLTRQPAAHRAGPDSARLAKAWSKARQY